MYIVWLIEINPIITEYFFALVILVSVTGKTSDTTEIEELEKEDELYIRVWIRDTQTIPCITRRGISLKYLRVKSSCLDQIDGFEGKTMIAQPTPIRTNDKRTGADLVKVQYPSSLSPSFLVMTYIALECNTSLGILSNSYKQFQSPIHKIYSSS